MTLRYSLALAAAILLAGCRTETPVERGAREYRAQQKQRMAQARLETALSHTATNATMVAASQRNGLGLALRVDTPELRPGEPLRLHLAYENLAAPGPVSAATCQGFSLTAENDAGQEVTAPVVFQCAPDDTTRGNNAELPAGELKTANLTAPLHLSHPGRYILHATWQAARPRLDAFQPEDAYPPVISNAILLTVH